MMVKTTVPFSGFYETLHSDCLETELEQLIDYDDEEGLPEGWSKAGDHAEGIRWACAHRLYAEKYVEYLALELELSMEFEELWHPWEYNFETDTVLASISEEDVQKIYKDTPPDKLIQLAKDRFTSRDGFSSYYDPDINTWGALGSWDHHQIGTLLQAYLDQEKPSCESGSQRFCQWAECEIMESARCNGVIGDILWRAMKPATDPATAPSS